MSKSSDELKLNSVFRPGARPRLVSPDMSNVSRVYIFVGIYVLVVGIYVLVVGIQLVVVVVSLGRGGFKGLNERPEKKNH